MLWEQEGEKKPLPLKLMGLRKPHRQKAIIFYSDLRGKKKKSENMSFTADYNGQAVSVFHVWLPSIRRRRLIGPGTVWLMQSHRRGGAVQSHKRSQVITYVKRNGFSLKTLAAIGRRWGYRRRGYRRRGALAATDQLLKLNHERTDAKERVKTGGRKNKDNSVWATGVGGGITTQHTPQGKLAKSMAVAQHSAECQSLEF